MVSDGVKTTIRLMKAPLAANVNSLKAWKFRHPWTIRRVLVKQSGSTVTSEQARLVAEHVTVVKDSSTVTSTGTSNSQDLILAELQKMSQRFSKLEEQTSQDRSVLSELVNQVHSNNQKYCIQKHYCHKCRVKYFTGWYWCDDRCIWSSK